MTRSSNVTAQYLLEIETVVPWRTVWQTSVTAFWTKLEHIAVFLTIILAKSNGQTFWSIESKTSRYFCISTGGTIFQICLVYSFLKIVFPQSCACAQFDVYATQCQNNGFDAANWRENVAYCRKLLIIRVCLFLLE